MITAAVEDSLRRLQTDYLDLYYAHEDDADTPQEEYLAAFDGLVRAGKVRELGASNFTAARLRSAADVAREAGLTAFTVSQDQYNLVERSIEADVLPAAVELGLVEISYYSLASGFLTGKYRPGVEVPSARAGKAAAYLEEPANVRLLDTLAEIAGAHSVSVTAVSLAWLRQQQAVGVPLASARTPAQLGPLFESAGVTLSAEELLTLSR